MQPRHFFDLLLHTDVVYVTHPASIRGVVSHTALTCRAYLLVAHILQLRQMLHILTDHDVLVGVFECVHVCWLASEHGTATCVGHLRVDVVSRGRIIIARPNILLIDTRFVVESILIAWKGALEAVVLRAQPIRQTTTIVRHLGVVEVGAEVVSVLDVQSSGPHFLISIFAFKNYKN